TDLISLFGRAPAELPKGASSLTIVYTSLHVVTHAATAYERCAGAVGVCGAARPPHWLHGTTRGRKSGRIQNRRSSPSSLTHRPNVRRGRLTTPRCCVPGRSMAHPQRRRCRRRGAGGLPPRASLFPYVRRSERARMVSSNRAQHLSKLAGPFDAVA